MSRVFDALLQLKTEANGSTSLSGPKGGACLEDVYAGATGQNGVNGKLVAAGLPTVEAASKPWWERLEERFLGWGLDRYNSYPIIALEKDSRQGEQYRILREKLKKVAHEKKAHCFCVTSAVKGDGKTLVAVNLAVALALASEQKVLLIDGDLRGPQVHRYFNVHSAPGLADYLSSDSANEVVAGYLHDTFAPNLRILPAGNPTDFSSELLCNARMRSLMAELRSTYQDHQIIFDSSPILATPDPLVLARQVDGTLIVARAGKTPYEYLLESFHHLDPSKVIGMVLNDVEIPAGSHYYYSYRK